MMDGRRRRGDDLVKKGPWKEEEDQMLINHVKKHGPRDWSSLRSKGLLLRTGKSCRLRWVNKLRPNLKTGIKFSSEEERTVIDLQAQFGNKWARIATYLPGRTDNDVKNFWSSRKKRLARILQTTTSSSSTSNEVEASHSQLVPSLQLHKFNSGYELDVQQEVGNGSTNMLNPTPLEYRQSLIDQPELNPNDNLYDVLQPSLLFPPQFEIQEFIPRYEDPTFFDIFGHTNALEIGAVHLPSMPPCLEPVESIQNLSPDSSFIDDFPPMDIYEHIEPLQSPSDW